MTVNELGAYLQSLGIATPGTDLFYHDLPATPANVVVLTEYGGTQPDMPLRTDEMNVEYPRIQVLVRWGIPAATGWAKAEAIYQALSQIGNETLSNVRYLKVLALQQPFFLRKDDNDRTMIVFNVECWKSPS